MPHFSRSQSGLPSVLIVLLNWNSLAETTSSLAAVLALDYPNFSVLVIDNGSTDGSQQALPEHIGSLRSAFVQLLQLPENMGYTGGCNHGIRLALGRNDDYVWLLNNDATTAPDTLSSLVRLAESDLRLGLVSPQILSRQESGRPLNLGGLYQPEVPSHQSTRTLDQALAYARDTPDRVTVLGTALLLRTSLLRQIGLLDDRFFAYWEDTDLSVRSIEAGFRNAIDFRSSVLHSNTNYVQDPNHIKPHFWYYMARNETLFWRKHLGFGLPLLKACLWALKLNRIYLQRLAPSPDTRRALLAGIWDGWLGRTGPWHTARRAPALLTRLLTPFPPRPGPSLVASS